MNQSWRELKPGMHVRLSCGCEGFVLQVTREAPTDFDEGFVVLYTKGFCMGSGRARSMEEAYLGHAGPFTNNFNGGLADGAMPWEPAPVPGWWEKAPTEHHEVAGDIPAVSFDLSTQGMYFDCGLYLYRRFGVEKAPDAVTQRVLTEVRDRFVCEVLRPETVYQVRQTILAILQDFVCRGELREVPEWRA